MRGFEQLRAKDISDDYIEWLGYANVGMLMPGNLYSFDLAVQNLPTQDPILEIGAFSGLSTNAIAYYLRKHGKTNLFFNCDKWQFADWVADEQICDRPIAEYENFIRDNYRRCLEMFSRDNLPHTIELYSDELFALWAEQASYQDLFGRDVQLGGPISFAYIDGNHAYDYAWRDFENCDRYLVPGGYILFDDSSDHSPHESRKAAQQAARRTNYEVVIKNPNYLLRKRA
jgi:hypothetical protein